MKPHYVRLLVGRAWLLIGMAPLASAQVLLIDLSNQPISLLPDLPNQQVTLWIANPGAADVLANAATFKFQIDDGPGGENAPRMMGIDVVEGTPWSLAGGIQNNITSLAAYHDVRVFANFFGGQYAVLPAGGSTPLGTITFDTTGVSGGTWHFQMADLSVDPVNTKYELLGGGTLFPTVTLGSVTVVPEAELAGTVVALCLLGSLGFKRWIKRDRTCGGAGARPRSTEGT